MSGRDYGAPYGEIPPGKDSDIDESNRFHPLDDLEDSDFEADTQTTDSLADLEGDFDAELARERNESRPKFPCGACLGTGRYHGPRTHQEKAHCFACKGKGFFLTSPHQREKARDSAAKRKAKAKAEVAEIYAEDGTMAFLLGAAQWSEFAASLLERIQGGRELTERQAAAVASMRAKCEARKAERKEQRKAEQAAEAEAPRFAALAEHFLTAAASLKWPKLRLATEAGEPVVLSRSGPASRNPGHINVTDGGSFGNNRYYGRIDPTGKAFLRRDIPAEIEAELTAINDDPDEAVRVTGQRTGKCCCCGRELTNPESIDAGIGPICAGNWGF